MELEGKLRVLADASRFDLACACGTKDREDHRQRSDENMWLYPVSLPDGGKSVMLKTLMSNVCVNDCKYCPFRAGQDPRRCSLQPEEVARLTMEYASSKKIIGLFLSSGVAGNPDTTMERMTAVAKILRQKYRYRGFVHLKVLPGASNDAIDDMLRYASAVSVNVEAPTKSSFARLSDKKDFIRDIVNPMRHISEMTAKGSPFSRVRQTTQFIVGASDERDEDIVRATFGMYKRLNLQRVYYSAYQRGFGEADLPGEMSSTANDALLTREHRLYQSDFLIRQYNWSEEDFLFDSNGSLDLSKDPKEIWADRHPEFFPLSLRKADREELLRVPGLGPVSVKRILKARKEATNWTLEDIGIKGKRLEKVRQYATEK